MIKYKEMMLNQTLEMFGTEKTKMAYNAKNAEQTKSEGGNLPEDSILTGVITRIDDGIVKDFIPKEHHEKWNNLDSHAIELNIELHFEENGEKKVENIKQLFTYIDEDGKTKFTPKSNLGKYFKKYDKLPEPGDQIKIITNESGHGKVKIE